MPRKKRNLTPKNEIGHQAKKKTTKIRSNSNSKIKKGQQPPAILEEKNANALVREESNNIPNQNVAPDFNTEVKNDLRAARDDVLEAVSEYEQKEAVELEKILSMPEENGNDQQEGDSFSRESADDRAMETDETESGDQESFLADDRSGNLQEVSPKDLQNPMSAQKNISHSDNANSLSKTPELYPELNSPKPKLEKVNDNHVQGKVAIYRKIALTFVLLTVILLMVVAYFSLVKLSISLIYNKERLSSNLSLEISNQRKSSQISDKVILPGLIEELAIEDELVASGTGEKIMGEGVNGRVLIINNYSKNQPLVASTRLLTLDNKLFRIKNTVNVPAGGSVEAEIYPDKSSPEMAIEPTTFTIPGLWAGLQDKIYAKSSEKFVYEQQIKKYLKQSDLDKAESDLKQILLDKIKNNFGSNYKGYNKTFYKINEDSLSQETKNKAGDEVDNFTIKMKAKVVVVAFSTEQVEKQAKLKISSLLPDNKEIVAFNQAGMTYNLDNYDLAAGKASFTVSFDGEMSLKNEADLVDKNKLVGLNKNQLEDYLRSFPEIKSYQIVFFPRFIEKAPSLVDRIEIKVQK